MTRVLRLVVAPLSGVDSPLSSETTAFHTDVKPEPGSSVNDGISLVLVEFRVGVATMRLST